MKTLLLLALCSLVLLYSCGKKTVDPQKLTYAMSAVVDGKYETFTSGDSVRAIGSTGVYITGFNDTTNDRIVLIALNGKGFSTGTYSDTTKADIVDSQILFYPAADYTNYYYSYYIAGTYNFTSFVTITAISSTNLQGTFSGNVVLVNYISGTSGLKSKTITNGQFNINIKP